MELLHKELTGKIIKRYYAVYNFMSHDYPEFIYKNAMIYELENAGIQCSTYKEKLVGIQKLSNGIKRKLSHISK